MIVPGTITVLYFAKFREQLGCARERFPLPALPSATVQAVLDQLTGRDDRHRSLLGPDCNVLIAINSDMARRNSLLQAGDELALFPPVTGG